MNTLYFVLFLPLLTAVINRLMAGRLGKGASSKLAITSVGVAFIFAAISFWNLSQLPVEQRSLTLNVFDWLKVGSETMSFKLLLDPLSAVMICVVTGVGFLIHVYSSEYMHEEDDYEYGRYFAYLNFFVFSMLTLVLAANFIVLFMGWELVGVSSYLLIGYYRLKDSAANAGKKAFIVNRVGDFGFILGIFIIMGVFGSVDFADVLPAAAVKLGQGTALATTVALLLFMGSMGKSAQLPLHVWLPDAMEGPLQSQPSSMQPPWLRLAFS
jgi:NADH-quinone oxidoreductase subunit L